MTIENKRKVKPAEGKQDNTNGRLIERRLQQWKQTKKEMMMKKKKMKMKMKKNKKKKENLGLFWL